LFFSPNSRAFKDGNHLNITNEDGHMYFAADGITAGPNTYINYRFKGTDNTATQVSFVSNNFIKQAQIEVAFDPTTQYIQLVSKDNLGGNINLLNYKGGPFRFIPVDGDENNIVADDVKLTWGLNDDSSILYDGSHMIINPKEIGSGAVNITGHLNVIDSNLTVSDRVYIGTGNTYLYHNNTDNMLWWDNGTHLSKVS